MNKYRKHIDQFFREKLGNYRETPPPDVWDSLEQRLDGLATVTKPAPGRWMWHVAIVSVILFLGASVGRKYYTGSNSNTDSKQLAANEQATITGSGQTGTSATATTANNAGSTNSPAAATEGNTTNNSPADNNTQGKENTANIINQKQSNTLSAQNLQATHPDSYRDNNNQNPNNSKATAGLKNGNTKATAQNKKNGKINTGNKAYAKNTYNAAKTHPDSYRDDNNLSNAANEKEANENEPTNASPNTPLSSVKKPEVSKDAVKKPSTENKKTANAGNNTKKAKPSFARIEAGIKTGFEGGFTSDAATKFVVSPYLQYNLSPKFALVAQPGIKAANMPGHDIGTPTSYYKINSESSVVTQDGPTIPNTVSHGTYNDTLGYWTKYTFSQTHDSIVKSNKTTARTSMEYELPILLKYNLTKKLSVYGGVNLVYRQMVTITENTAITKDIARSFDTTFYTATAPIGSPSGLSMSYTGTPYSDYNGPLKPAQTGYQFGVGYVLGFSYTCHQKWLFDALIQQSPAAKDVKSGYNINSPLSTTYLRLSIGYKLTR
jgi:hypothetical protein